MLLICYADCPDKELRESYFCLLEHWGLLLIWHIIIGNDDGGWHTHFCVPGPDPLSCSGCRLKEIEALTTEQLLPT